MSEKKKTGFDVKSLGHLAPAALVAALVAATLPITVPLLREVPEKLSPVEEEVSPAETGSETEAPAKGDYTDGVYTGKGNGFGGQIEVKVIVEDKQIALVDILDSRKETAGYLSNAKAVIEDVLKKQTWEVDTVSGATITSKGILEAIENALTGKEPIDFVESVTGKPIQPEKPAIRVPQTQQEGSTKPIVVKPSKPSSPNQDKPIVVPPKQDTPGNNTPGTDTPGTDTPGSETPGTDTPGSETPGTDTPGSETPGTDIPGSETPGTETPGTDTPGSETPGTETPGTETPGTETPGTETPGTEIPEDPTQNPDNHRMTISVKAPENGEFSDYELMVDVVITDGKIVSISIPKENLYGGTENEDETNKSFVEKALEGLLDLILEKQDTKDVDVVSGATYSSQSILDAVHQALIEAGVIEPDPVEEAETETEKEETEQAGENAAAQKAEGTKEGKAKAEEKAVAEKAAVEKAAKEAAEKEAAEKAAREAAEKEAAEKAAREAAEKEAAEKAAREAAEKEAEEKAAVEKETEEATEEEESVKYKDGTYTISGWVQPNKSKKFSAYKLTLTVKVEDGKVTEMSLAKGNLYGGKKKVNSKNEKYTQDAWNDVKGYVLENNTADVDVTTGATSSSKAIIRAIGTLQKVTDEEASENADDKKKLITVTFKDEKGKEKTYTYKIESDK